jgi:hypothetical protein
MRTAFVRPGAPMKLAGNTIWSLEEAPVAGDLLLAADTTGTGHVTFTVGDPPYEALVVPQA